MVYTDAGGYVGNKRDGTRKAITVYLLLLGLAAAGGIVYLVAMQMEPSKFVWKEDRLAKEVDEATIQRATQQGAALLETYLLNQKDKKGLPLITFEKPAALDGTLAKINGAKKRNGESAGWHCEPTHAAVAGNPAAVLRYEIRAKLPNNPLNPEEDIAWLVIRVYRSEAEQREAFEIMKNVKGNSAVAGGGRYCIHQYYSPLNAPALQALQGATNQFLSGFLKQIPEPGSNEAKAAERK